ncbi:MAG: SidA/IucD/PvdA family monooxygenase [Myxococcales bacterium]|nr:SidA/IucD/PvdA family monooxygenase [Myxococcales bacterium]
MLISDNACFGGAGLEALEARVKHELELLSYPGRDWVIPRTAPDGSEALNVLVIGGGQGGVAVAAKLGLERVRGVRVVDANPAGQAGPWVTFARMITLRTPKHVSGPDLEVPALTVRAWYEAQHGSGTWDAVGLIPKETWNDYLCWVRRMFGVQLSSETRAGTIHHDPTSGLFEVPLTSPKGEERVWTRRVVLATGIEGSGDWAVPAIIKDALPQERYAHTRWPIDFDALVGKRIGVIGAGASAFDNASVALENGAAEVHLFFRRKRLVTVNPYRWAEFVGFLKHHADLSDADRWRFVQQIVKMGQLPPADTFRRATAHEGFHLHPGCGVEKVEPTQQGLVLKAGGESYDLDFLIVGTGFVTDLSRRKELAELEGKLLRWQDVYTPPVERRNADLERHPYLGSHFEFLPRDEADGFVRFVFNYTFGSWLSMGFGGSSISGMKYSVARIVAGITKSFYTEDLEQYFHGLESFAAEEFSVDDE